jgi:hypothetical protein
VLRIHVVLNWLNLDLSLASLSGSIQITMSAYDVILYFDYIYAWAYLTGPRGTKIMGHISYTLVSSPRDSTRIVDLG